MAGKEKGFSFLGLIIGIVILGLAGFGLTHLQRTIGENNNNQRKADISLNEYIKDGRDYPVGKYVSLDVRWVTGPYATNTHTETSNFIFSATSSEDNYYLVYLEDGTVMSICTSNKEEKEKLDKLAEWYVRNPEDYPMNGEVLHLQGDLKDMTESNDNEKELMGYYKSWLEKSGISQFDKTKAHFLYLDTRAGRGALYVWLIGGAVVLIVIIWMVSRSRKKKAAAAAAAVPPVPPTENTGW